MQQIFSNLDCALLAGILGAAMVRAWRFGLWIGRNDRKVGGQAPVSKFDDASLALLGLLLAFSFATSFSKYDARRLMVVADSDAIGDFYNSASLLKEPVRSKLRNLIREYMELRIQIARNPGDRVRFEQTLLRFEQMHVQMVELVDQGLRDGHPDRSPADQHTECAYQQFCGAPRLHSTIGCLMSSCYCCSCQPFSLRCWSGGSKECSTPLNSPVR